MHRNPQTGALAFCDDRRVTLEFVPKPGLLRTMGLGDFAESVKDALFDRF
jgi:hypothetical protein